MNLISTALDLNLSLSFSFKLKFEEWFDEIKIYYSSFFKKYTVNCAGHIVQFDNKQKAIDFFTTIVFSKKNLDFFYTEIQTNKENYDNFDMEYYENLNEEIIKKVNDVVSKKIDNIVKVNNFVVDDKKGLEYIKNRIG